MTAQDGPKRGNGKPAGPLRHGRGFAQVGGFLGSTLREASGKRGIAEARLLTAWDEIVGPALAALCRPVRITHSAKAFGGTLVLLAAPARGPELQMQEPEIIERVNACFGYRAVTRLRLTQTAASGFAEGNTPFGRKGAPEQATEVLPTETVARLADLTAGVSDAGLRGALDRLGAAMARRRLRS